MEDGPTEKPAQLYNKHLVYVQIKRRSIYGRYSCSDWSDVKQ